MTLADGNGAGSGHRDGLVGFAGGFRAPFGRYWLSGFLSDFGNGVRLAAFPLLVTQVTREPAAAVLIHEAGLVLIYVAAFGVGTGAALRGTAAVACVPRLVEPSDLDKANGRVIAGQIVGNELAGPAAGGWLFGMAAVLPFAVNAGTLGIAVLLLLTLPDVFAPRHVSVNPARAGRGSLRSGTTSARRWPGCDSILRSGTSPSWPG